MISTSQLSLSFKIHWASSHGAWAGFSDGLWKPLVCCENTFKLIRNIKDEKKINKTFLESVPELNSE